MLHKTILDFKSWGKHFLICFDGFTLRVHFMLFGSYRINEAKDAAPRLSLQFEEGVLNFYTCSVKYIEEPLDEVYDWATDIMSDKWDPAAARKKLKAHPDMLACDALLDQDIFAGSGNIIKNEVLFRTRIHPLSLIGKLPPKQLKLLVDETRNYAFDFLEWKKKFVLKQHWARAHQKNLPALQYPVYKRAPGKAQTKVIFLQQLPGTV